MNIKRAKEEIKNTIEAYLLKDEYGEYEIPVNAQRPVFLIGAPGIGKTQIMEQIARECKVRTGVLYYYPPYKAKCHWTSLYIPEGI